MTTEWWYGHAEHLKSRIFDIVDTIEGIVVRDKTAAKQSRRPSLAVQFSELHVAVAMFEAECRREIFGAGANPVPISGSDGSDEPPSD